MCFIEQMKKLSKFDALLQRNKVLSLMSDMIPTNTPKNNTSKRQEKMWQQPDIRQKNNMY